MQAHGVGWKDMRKGCRLVGTAVRALVPPLSERSLQVLDRGLVRLQRGRWMSRRTYVEPHEVTRPDGSQMRVLVCRPKKVQAQSPLTGLLWLHGGGYAIGIPETDATFCDLLCGDGSVVAVLPDYTRSLDAPYPAALMDCHLALVWMAENAESLGIRPDQIFVGGESAGGGLTAALSLYVRDVGGPRVAFQMPLYPMIDDRELTASSKDNDAPVWNSVSNRLAWELYLRGVEGEVPAYAAPARAQDLSGLPPACTYVGTIEPFHDETMDYVERLREAGVPTFTREFEGCFHAFDLVAHPSAVAASARRFLLDTFRFAQGRYFAS